MGLLQSKVLGSNPDNKPLPGSPNKEEGIQEEKQPKIEEEPEKEEMTEKAPEKEDIAEKAPEKEDLIEKTPEKTAPPKPVEDSVVIENEETINEEITMEIEKEEEDPENIENDSENAFIDPRSPSANIERTPVALENNSVPEVQNDCNITPLREKPSKSGAGDNLRRRALMKKSVPVSVNKENQENQENNANMITERPSVNELPGSAPVTPKPSEMSVLANEMEKLGLNSPVVAQK